MMADAAVQKEEHEVCHVGAQTRLSVVVDMPSSATEYFVIFTGDEDSDNNMESLEPGVVNSLQRHPPPPQVHLSLGSLCDSNQTSHRTSSGNGCRHAWAFPRASQGVQVSRPSSHHRSACYKYTLIDVVAAVGGHVTSRHMVPTVCWSPQQQLAKHHPAVKEQLPGRRCPRGHPAGAKRGVFRQCSKTCEEDSLAVQPKTIYPQMVAAAAQGSTASTV